MKAVKRVRYGEKEKAALTKMLDAAKEAGDLKTGQDISENGRSERNPSRWVSFK